jgi:SAM-dependent methyltransferase
MHGVSRFDRLLRRFFPSISKPTFNPVFKFIVNLSDVPLKLVFPDFRALPPNHMRLRVGSGNRFFNNQVYFLTTAVNSWIEVFASGAIRMDSTIVDIGCGCGRSAHILRSYSSNSGAFTGTYIGVDIDEEMLDWCRAHYDPAHFRFHLSTDASKSYNRESIQQGPYHIPEPDETADLVRSSSLFTHLLEEQALNYLRESFRLLRSGGTISHSVFCMDYPPPTFGTRHTFSHRVGNAYVESLAQPEAAVAYSEEFLISLAHSVGFVDAKVRHRLGAWQASLVARKP